ncbi:hypothetical protein J4E06_09835 [Muricauda sp. NFXS6]|uniref:hypothetical protein n=1 Tax=Allomuricauda sp. NFXS6 TaxID=2819094 RepID=UPI0032DFDB2D
MNTRIFFYIILFFGNISINQEKTQNGCLEYYEIANKAYCSYLSKDFDSSIKFYLDAFEVRPQGCNPTPHRNDQYLLAKAFFQKKKYLEGLDFLEDAITNGGLKWEIIAEDSIIKNLPDNYKITKTRFNNLFSIWENKVDQKLKKEVNKMITDDQFYRKKAKFFFESEIDSIKELQKKLDSINAIKLKKIILTQGFPSFSKMGHDKAAGILLHTSRNFRQIIFPYLLKEIDKGNISPAYVGQMLDQELYLRINRQSMGFFLQFDENYNKDYVAFETNDIDSINIKRNRIGAVSLECYSKETGANLPISIKLNLKYNPKN